MKIVGYTDNMDLRTVVSKSVYLRGLAKRFDLQNDQAVCFTNKSLTRFRLVFKVRNAIFLCIPEIDEKNKLSVFLMISEELAHFAGIDTRQELQLVSKFTEKRIEKKQVAKRRANNRKMGPKVVWNARRGKFIAKSAA